MVYISIQSYVSIICLHMQNHMHNVYVQLFIWNPTIQGRWEAKHVECECWVQNLYSTNYQTMYCVTWVIFILSVSECSPLATFVYLSSYVLQRISDGTHYSWLLSDPQGHAFDTRDESDNAKYYEAINRKANISTICLVLYTIVKAAYTESWKHYNNEG